MHPPRPLDSVPEDSRPRVRRGKPCSCGPGPEGGTIGTRGAARTVGFEERPVLVFWESTRACPLACAHCRASAIEHPLPGELSTEEAGALIDRMVGFGRPYPTLIVTGGDPMGRSDLSELVQRARARGLSVAVSPAVSERLGPSTWAALHDLGVSAVSLSLDGGTAATHDRIRGVAGLFERSRAAILDGLRAGVRVQVNSTVMPANVAELPRLFATIRDLGVRTWEVFFLIRTGRGSGLEELPPGQAEDVAHFLYDASRYGVLVRAVEAPFVRRVLRERTAAPVRHGGPLYDSLRTDLEARLGPGTLRSSLAPRGTLDGDGILFVGFDGTLYPGGFLEYPLGNIRSEDIVATYRDHGMLQRIRRREFRGACGRCAYRAECGGSRARAFVRWKDALGSDPACPLTVGWPTSS